MNAEKIFVENLITLRKARNWTQEDFAERVDLSLRGYQKYEQGQSHATPSVIERFAKALGCEAHALLMDPSKYKKSDVPSFTSASGFLSAFDHLPPDLQYLVLAIVHHDATYLLRASKSFRQKSLAFVRRLEK